MSLSDNVNIGTVGGLSMMDSIVSNNDMIGFILQWSVAIIVAFFVGKLLINIAIGSASRSLNDEVERLATSRAIHAQNITHFQLLADERRKDLNFLEMSK